MLSLTLFPVIAGCGVAAFTFGALSLRVTDSDDLLAMPAEALILGLAFALAASPGGWAIVARAILIVPSFFLYLSVFLGKPSPLPFYAAFAMAGLYSLFLTALSSYFSEKSRESGSGDASLRPDA